MLRIPAAGPGGLAACVLATGCVTPLSDLEMEVERERAAVTAPVARPDGAEDAPADAADAVPAPDDITDASTLADCTAYALRHSPELEAAFFAWRAALERRPQETALPDPRLSFGVFLEEVETRTGPQEARVGASQSIPWFGKLRLRGEMADEAAAVELARLEAVTLELVRRVRRAYYELYYLRGAVEITRENVALLEQFEEIALARIRVAAGSYADVVRLQVELGTLRDRLRELEDRRRPLAGRLNAALARPADAPAPWPATIPDVGVEPDRAALESALRAHNPRLLALDRETARQRRASELAHLAAWPDLTFAVDYIATGSAGTPVSGSGDDPVVAGVSFNVPIWREKYEAGVREALRHRLATAGRRADLANRLTADLEQALFDLRDAQRKVVLYRDELLPKARESLEASRRGYENASVVFTDLLDTERVLLELQLAGRRARADAAAALAEIDALTAGATTMTSAAPPPGEETLP
ncbi:MAG: TolC family protein [Planctomycetota bacterium]|jgi:outer membrane protein TolC